MVQPTLIRETGATPLPHRTAGGAARRILLVKLDAIGDYLLFRETLRFLRNSPAYREAHITFLGNPVWRDLALAYDADCADEWLWLAQAPALLRLPHENLLPGAVWRRRVRARQAPLRAELRALGFDEVISLRLFREPMLDVFFEGLAPCVTGVAVETPLPTDRCYTRLLKAEPRDVPPTARRFVFHRNRAFAAALARKPCEVPLSLPAAAQPPPDTPQAPVVVLCPAASHWTKRLPFSTWLRLIRWFLCHTPATIAIVGGSDVAYLCHQLCFRAGDPRVVVWTLTLPQLAERFRTAALVIANDSAPMHLAALAGARVVCAVNGYAGRDAFWPYPDGRIRMARPLRPLSPHLPSFLPLALLRQARAIRSVSAEMILAAAGPWADGLKPGVCHALATPLTPPCRNDAADVAPPPSGPGHTRPLRLLISSSEAAPWYDEIQDVGEHYRRQPYTLGAIAWHLHHDLGWEIAWAGRRTSGSPKRLGQLVASFRPDIIYTYGAWTALRPLALRRARGAAGEAARTAIIVHGWDDAYGDIWGSKLGWFGRVPMTVLERRIVAQSDGVVTLSRFLQARARRRGIEAYYIPNGADPVAPPPVGGAADPAGGFTLVYTGDQASWKRTADICRSMAQLPADVRLILTGRTYPYLKRYASERCVFRGFVSKDEQLRILRKADALVCTADQDCNAKLQEYLRWDKPCLGYDGRANLFFTQGQNALLCDGDYAPAIRRLRTEPGLAGALVANARRDIPVLRWSRIAGLFDTLFRALIAERGEASCAADRTTP